MHCSPTSEVFLPPGGGFPLLKCKMNLLTLSFRPLVRQVPFAQRNLPFPGFPCTHARPALHCRAGTCVRLQWKHSWLPLVVTRVNCSAKTEDIAGCASLRRLAWCRHQCRYLVRGNSVVLKRNYLFLISFGFHPTKHKSGVFADNTLFYKRYRPDNHLSKSDGSACLNLRFKKKKKKVITDGGGQKRSILHHK